MLKGVWVSVGKMVEASSEHDYDKLSEIDRFHSDFQTGFKETGWWENHRRMHRHHLNYKDGIPADVNLLDVLEYVSDCVMAGMARSGKVYEIVATPELLDRAFKNTVEMLKSQVVIEDDPVIET